MKQHFSKMNFLPPGTRPLSASSSATALSRPQSAKMSGSRFLFESTTSAPQSRPTSAGSSRGGGLRPQSAQTAELRRLSSMSRPASATSLRSINAAFRASYPLATNPAEFMEEDRAPSVGLFLEEDRALFLCLVSTGLVKFSSRAFPPRRP